MSRNEVYEQAAKQAEADIPAKEAEIRELEERLRIANRQLTYLKGLATFGKEIAGNLTGTASFGFTVTGELSAQQDGVPAPPKSVYIKLHELFLASDKPLTIKEIQQGYAIHHGETVASSSLYAALNKGLRKNTFIQENSAWRRTTKEERNAKKV